uniref:Activating signal cointegrator 1 complex subunit 3 n=1 Tax=Syphacia muris TaxID=451379 RepID=A0A0N5ALP4_9BILA
MSSKTEPAAIDNTMTRKKLSEFILVPDFKSHAVRRKLPPFIDIDEKYISQKGVDECVKKLEMVYEIPSDDHYRLPSSSFVVPSRTVHWKNSEQEKLIAKPRSGLIKEQAAATTSFLFLVYIEISKYQKLLLEFVYKIDDFQLLKTAGLTAQELLALINSLYEDSGSIRNHFIELIQSRKNAEEIQSELIDLFGFDQFELVQKILDSRDSLTKEFQTMKKRGDLALAMINKELFQVTEQVNGAPYCQQVVVDSTSELELRRGFRKEKKKVKKELDRILRGSSEKEKLEFEIAYQNLMKQKYVAFHCSEFILMDLQLELNDDALGQSGTFSIKNSFKCKTVYPYIFDAMQSADMNEFIINGTKFCLPAGAKRVRETNYEEITVPPSESSVLDDVKSVYIKDMDTIGQTAFEGFEKLNIVQSLVFEQAYKTKENLLICAPTGAGKTNIAMLTILNVIHGFIVNDVIQKNDFKALIIYITPMKALATEMTANFGRRLEKLGLKVRELTGDMNLSRKEIAETQMLVLTPEKWDVLTRKSTDAISKYVRLLIIDEVHLLHDERGPVIETIVARTLRQVEMSQQSVRIVGLSATLPNYEDVAQFLCVNPYKGLFFFDDRFRPVPLVQTFVGVRKSPNYNSKTQSTLLDDVCFEKVLSFVQQGHQVLVFVHSRNATEKLVTYFRTRASQEADKLRNESLYSMFQFGYGIHHAGLMRQDRLAIEKLFAGGYIKVLCCTATLAWGVNLPAYAVVIRGTEIFDAKRGAFNDIGVLDVQQIFGRAGRPQYERKGHGVIITWHEKMNKYLSMLVRQAPIESQFMKSLYNNLNAEISLGIVSMQLTHFYLFVSLRYRTISNITEAVEWLKYSYFYIRAKANPMAYGITYESLSKDPDLTEYLTAKVKEASQMLDFNQMIRFDSATGFLSATDLGRIASHFYITYETIETFQFGESGIKLSEFLTDYDILSLISMSTEFAQIKLREDEFSDLEKLTSNACPLNMNCEALASVSGKVSCLIQAFISRSVVRNFALMSELLYIEQNVSRLCRAMFEIVLRKRWAEATNACLNFAKCLEKRIWPFQTPLRQMVPEFLSSETIAKIERRKIAYERLREMSAKELGI